MGAAIRKSANIQRLQRVGQIGTEIERRRREKLGGINPGIKNIIRPGATISLANPEIKTKRRRVRRNSDRLDKKGRLRNGAGAAKPPPHGAGPRQGCATPRSTVGNGAERRAKIVGVFTPIRVCEWTCFKTWIQDQIRADRLR